MFSILQSRRIRGAAGDPLPTVWKSFADKGIVFRRGQFVIISAGGGTGKSALTLNYALKADVSCLYLSADSDAFTQVARAVSIRMGWTFAESCRRVLADDIGEAAESLRGSPVRFNYLASPSQADIETLVAAYDEVYGDYPDIIIVDNITNVRSAASEESGNPFEGLEGLTDYLHDMARKTQSCVIGLHHVTGPYNNGDKPIPMDGVKGQITRVPEMVLTVWKSPGDGADVLHVCPVKNRAGKPDTSGQNGADLEFDGARMSIRDVTPAKIEQPAEAGGMESPW